jgi:anti-anti-sigma factor
VEIKVSLEQVRVPITVMHVHGNIDSATYEAFKTKADELIQDGARYILVDLTQVPFVSSSGLRALHTILNKLRVLQPNSKLSDMDMKMQIAKGLYKSPHLKLLNLSKETRIAFELSGFYMFIETFTDLKTALKAF